MDLEFDKEMDTLLRQTARGETVSAGRNSNAGQRIPDSGHLDADELSAFAENALPDKARQRYLLHLADCDECRKILSSLITLNAEQPDEIVRAEEKQFAPTPVRWYRKIFAVLTPIYTMGALVLVFSGIVAYTVLRNGGASPNTEVSQTYERQPGGKGMSSDGDAVSSESYPSTGATASNTLMSNAAATNSSSNSAANFSAMPPAPAAATANSNAAVARSEKDKNLPALAKPLSPLKEPIDSAKMDDLPVAGRLTLGEKEAESQLDAEVRQSPPRQTQESLAQNQTQIMPDSGSVRRAPMPMLQAQTNKEKKLADSTNEPAKKSASAANVGGKTFKRTSNVWYDSAYRGQPTTNVARGTNEYRKLDSDLRGIAENLGGIIVVVWKSKAYRIQ